MARDDSSPWLARGIYLFGVAFVITAGIDLFTTVWPMRPADMTWRYGFLGLAAGYLQTPTLGLLLAMLAAVWRRNTVLLRALGVTALVAAVVLVPVMGLFGLDVLAMRQLRASEMQSAVMAGGLFQEVKYVMSFCVLAFIGYGAVKTAKTLDGGRGSADAAGIVSTRR